MHSDHWAAETPLICDFEREAGEKETKKRTDRPGLTLEPHVPLQRSNIGAQLCIKLRKKATRDGACRSDSFNVRPTRCFLQISAVQPGFGRGNIPEILLPACSSW